jgi:predicted phage tail protein
MKFENLQGRGGGDPDPPQSRNPVEAPEGIRNVLGTGDSLAVSLTEIEVMDLISEGEIDGPLTGSIAYEGSIGNTGWTTATITPYPEVPAGSGIHWLRSIYWNKVPVVSETADGDKFNFQNVQVAFTPGTPNGANIRALNSNLQEETTVTRPINERLRFGSSFSKVYRVLNSDVRSVQVNIKFGALSEVDTRQSTYGDTNPTTVKYDIYYRPIKKDVSAQPVEFVLGESKEVFGKVANGYLDTTKIDFYTQEEFDDANLDNLIGWEIKIERLTEDATTQTLRNQTSVDSITEFYGDIYTYPNSAIVASKFSAEYFAQIPDRAIDAKLIKVLIPNNYDPIKRSYGSSVNAYDEDGNLYTTPADGSWDGDWKRDSDGNLQKEWTDNPAWCYHDILSSNRFGLGDYIDSSSIDKWTLFSIAQYCDILVADGQGGIEPRFSCNLILTSRTEAYKVINDMASIFRAVNYYSAGTIYTSQDSPKATITQFTNANVKDGDFRYSSSSKRVRHSVAVVRYNDATNFFKPAIEYVEDLEGIKRYGVRETEITAFGTTSRGQALRLGRWALLSETLETDTVSFVAGMEGAYLRPGDVFSITDRNKIGYRFAGRTTEVTNYIGGSGEILLDDAVTGLIAGQKYKLSLLTPTYNYDTAATTIDSSNDIGDIRKSNIQTKFFDGSAASLVAGTTQVVVDSAFDTGNYLVSGNLIWSVEPSGSASDGALIDNSNTQLYRAIRISETNDVEHEVAGLLYSPDKFAKIESGLLFGDEEAGIVPQGPSAIQLLERSITSNTKAIDYSFVVPNLSGVSSYYVYSKDSAFSDPADFADNTYLTNVLPKLKTSDSYVPTVDGTYYFRVYSVNQFGNRSTTYAEDSIPITNIQPIKDVVISSLTDEDGGGSDPEGTKSGTSITKSSPTFVWEVGFADGVSVPNDFTYSVSIRQQSGPTNNTPSTNIYHQETGFTPDTPNSLEFTFDIDDNIAAVSTLGENGPFREYDVVVSAIDGSGNNSAGSNFSNTQGYDIVEVNNERPESLVLKGSDAGDIYLSDIWITADGDVKIDFSEGSNYTDSFFDDMVGGYVYVSSGEFTEAEAKGLTSTTKVISRYKFNQVSNPTVISSTKLTGVSQAYASVSIFDAMDKAILDKGEDIEDDLNMSNVTNITKRGAFTKDSYLYRSWIEINASYTNQTVSDWWDKSAGIQSVSLQPWQETITVAGKKSSYSYEVTRYDHRFVFDEQLPNATYVVQAWNQSNMSKLSESNFVAQTKDYLQVRYLNGTYFIGILHNGT